MQYKIEWTLQSPIETQLQSDTIFGHICWALATEFGEEELLEFLDKMREPKLLLSSAFPKNTLPLPKLKPFYEKLPPDLPGALLKRKKRKDAKKLSYLPIEMGLNKRQDYVHSEALEQNEAITAMLEESFKLEKDLVTHNSINRITGTTTKGGASLYAETVTFARENTVFESYLQTDEDTLSEDKLRAVFSFIENSGFGRNKHTGRGKFRIAIQECELPKVENPNAWLLLSNMVPAPDDPAPACYEGFVKYGRLGGKYATGNKSPFKKPLFLFKPGAVFFGSKQPRGMLVQKIHPDDPGICQHAYAMSLGFHIKGGQNA